MIKSSIISSKSIEILRSSTAPIAISKIVQNMQLLFKTMIIFLQKCFIQQDFVEQRTRANFDTIYSTVLEILDLKDVFGMELGYAASMIQILLSTYETNQNQNSIRNLIEKCLRKYEKDNQTNGCGFKINIRDLCFFQAIFTMLKAQQIQNENFIDLFESILLHTLNRFIYLYLNICDWF